ncbi:MAG: hypothetical protein EOM14_10525 [Clostridia bacterium]|nr:hypothetical protein [Clostridia bacterium]
MSFTAIDLSALPPPEVVEMLDFEQILLALRADVASRDPSLIAVLGLESEPILLEPVDFILSDAGQDIVAEEGFIRL